ncbi:MAG: SRPBCC domain-containing protein [Planctomycetota bacterium]
MSNDKYWRRVETEVEIEASPEAVWKAIATGPGIKSWFMGMESEFDEQVGGEVRTKMGDAMVPIAKVTAWDPPKHFATRGENAFGPGSPAIGYEWTVEAVGGGKCVMRMVQTLFAEDDSWDTQVGDTEAGWPAFFHVLRNYVERHNEEESGVVQAMGPVAGTKEEALERLANALGIGEIAKGASVDCHTGGVPAFSGEIEDVVRGRSDRIMLRLDRPFPGTGWIGVGPIGGNMTAIVTMYYYGDGAAEAAARDHTVVTGWLAAHGQAVSS